MTTDELAQLLQPLVAPFEGGGLKLPNRFALAPMTRLKAIDGVPTEADADYYRRRAEGGAGLIITEGTLLRDPAAGFSKRIPAFFGSEAAEGWKRIVESVHEAGSAIVAQLWHTGIQRGVESRFNPGVPPRSPSGLDLQGRPVAEPLTVGEMGEIAEHYAESAALARNLGFDGVELHGAHGYLLDEFVWEQTNRRSDAYGGGLGERMRFPSEVVTAIRDAIGSGFPLIYRFSQWKADQYDAQIAGTPADLEEILTPLMAAGVDIFHPSTRRHWLPAFEGSELSLAGWTKHITGLPVIAVGSVGVDTPFGGTQPSEGDSKLARLQLLMRQFETGEFDIIAIGRAMLADAAWVKKTLAGEVVRPYQKTAADPASERTY